MRQATLQLKTRIKNANIMNSNIEVKKVILNTMLAISAALILSYIFILGNIVFNIVERKALEKEMLGLSNDVSKLELSYLSVSNSVDMTLSSSMGFKEIKPTFATRKSLGYNYTGEAPGHVKLNNNEI